MSGDAELTVDELWRAVPDDTWVVLKRNTGVHAGIDPRYSYYCEIGSKGDWRTGECGGASPAQALTRAILTARTVAG